MTVDSFLHIDLGDLTIRKEGGKVKAEFDVLIMNFGENGVPTGNLSKTFNVELTEEEFEGLSREGLVYALTFPVGRPGGYLLRAAVRDRESNRVGTASQFVFVPNVDTKRLALSGIAVNNLTYERWNSGIGAGGTRIRSAEADRSDDFDQFNDTALRRFKPGTVLVYALEAYNIRSTREGGLTLRTRLIKDGKILFEGTERQVSVEGYKKGGSLGLQGALNLAASLSPGEYALQVIVRDRPAKKKERVASQFIQFEIVDH